MSIIIMDICAERPVLNCVTCIGGMMSNIINRKKFVIVWNGIMSFDESFELGKVTNPIGVTKEKPPIYREEMRQAKNYLWCCIFVGVFGWTIVNQWGMVAFNERYLQNMSYMIVYVVHFAAVSKFCGLIFLLGQRFAHLNQRVRQQTKMKAHRNTKGLMKRIETSYNELMDVTYLLNDIYSLSLFLFHANLAYHIISNSYFILAQLIYAIHDWYLAVFLIQMFWMIMFCIQLFAMHMSCEYTSNEEFESTAHFMNNELQLTAGGFYIAGLASLLSTARITTTYLVILLQIPNT
ncbi:hypothetical protein QAD02_006507 [Eretmocerus hayati]|uniref:Uncharacterized protein n=1 Tax=Eretmocerus hayati TaxID=131215 RepID=A0ACC2N5D9_9HYME|nr:hypothetical protein QAD02_006507 [Eretmocerus hayati]